LHAQLRAIRAADHERGAAVGGPRRVAEEVLRAERGRRPRRVLCLALDRSRGLDQLGDRRGLPARAEQGDRVVATFSETLRVSTLCSTWSGDFSDQTLAALGDVTVTLTDGGVANFLHYMEDWPVGSSVNYRGSIVSLFISRQATGTYKCCERVYQYTARNYIFDTDFLLPALLPPATPMFRDVNTLTFRQLLRPNQ